MKTKKVMLGLFDSEEKTAHAIHALKNLPFSVEEVYSPVPVSELSEVLNLKKSKVGYFTLVGAIMGFFIGFWLSAWTAGQWSLIVSGKPVVSLIPFFIVGFELTILLGVVGNVIGFLFLAGLPKLKLPAHYDPRCTGAYFGVAVTCRQEDVEHLVSFFKSQGAHIGNVD